MLRLWPLSLMIAVAPVRAEEADPAAAGCGALDGGELILGSETFELRYRPAAGEFKLRWPARIEATTERPAQEISGGLDTVAVELGNSQPIRAAHRAKALKAYLKVVEAPGPRADAACAELQVARIELRIGEVVMASSHAPLRLTGPPKLQTRVTVGRLSREPQSAAVDHDYIRDRLLFRAESCVRREAGGRPVRGSVMLEVRSEGAGTVKRPTAPVDGLDHASLIFCLINAVYDDPGLAQSMPEGAHFYAPFYFRPDDSDRLLIHSKAP